MDNEYISQTFADMGMTTFHERIILTKVIFDQQPMDENSEILLKHAMEYGIYGTDVTYKAGRIASMSEQSVTAGKLRSWTAAVFLPYKRMKAHYPVLQKYPVLLPFCWMKRISGYLKNLPKYKKMMDYSNVTQATMR